jgi:hypothetical protein
VKNVLQNSNVNGSIGRATLPCNDIFHPPVVRTRCFDGRLPVGDPA